ncbi:hypothetical protein CkaCkLH20_06406 [Colletotrichum karsti]|uniref:Uncharacterized protein n=1 Tax=Colletotrichum karsti TaxID=1095194 RepID=A0A9P6I531_9PEZI|nr:uncharacterized protein CkaCkLH20_06406 [Colletotrichum karsti]KAF9875960.1 hypothetical protein CkaCkLH20_06406 [Colletotrichum karsti]
MSTIPRLLGLPQEVRDHIWDILGHNDDYTALIHTCSQIRSEVLDRLPHRRLLCHCHRQEQRIPHWKPDCQRLVNVDKLSIIVGPGDINKSYLRIEAVWKAQEAPNTFRLRKSVWSVRNRWSIFAKVLKYYEAKETVVVFEAPRSSFRSVGLLIALAKMCETMPVIDLLDGELGDLSIHFSEDGPGTTAFWERRVETDYRSSATSRDTQPLFYECMIIPFLYDNNRGPYDTRITFERPPANKSLLLKQSPRQPGLEELNWLAVESWMGHEEWGQGLARAISEDYVLQGGIALRWRRRMGFVFWSVRGFPELIDNVFEFYERLRSIIGGLVRSALQYDSPFQENPTRELKDLRRRFRKSPRGEEAKPEGPEEPEYFSRFTHVLEEHFVQWASTTSKFELCGYCCYGKRQSWGARCRSPTRSDSGHSV